MARVVWSEEALRALDAIGSYLSDVAPHQAASVLDRIRSATAPQNDFPRMGRMVLGFGRDSTREIVVDQFRVIYELRGDVVAVATVLHGAQDIEARLRALRRDL